MLRTVYLHGPLKEIHPEPIKVQGETVAEVVKSITRQLKGFAPNPVTGYKRILVVGYETEDSLYQPLEDTEELHIVPQFSGGKDNNPMVQILIGAALIGVGIALGPTGFFGSMFIKVGALAVLGGLAQMLSPTPPADTNDRSFYLGAPRNTVQIGTRIPILYGQRRVYGHYLSFNINSMRIDGAAQAPIGGK